MLATANLVVEGDVVDVGRGRILAGNSPMKQQLKEYRIAVTRIWKGPEAAGPLVVEGAGWSISPIPKEGEVEDGQVTDSARTDGMVAAMERLSAAGLRQQLQRDLRLVKTGAVTGERSSR
jgi:hypothetical protein